MVDRIGTEVDRSAISGKKMKLKVKETKKDKAVIKKEQHYFDIFSGCLALPKSLVNALLLAPFIQFE